MANRDNAMGFRVAVKFGPPKCFLFPVDASSSTAMFVGDAVVNNAAGSVRPAAAGFTSTGVGVVQALYDSNMIPVGDVRSSVSTKYLTGSVAGYALVALAIPGQIFIGQSQTGTSYAAADIFAAANLVAGSGSTTTARSGHELGATGGADFLLLGKVDEPENAYGSANVDFYFTFLGSTWGQVNPTGGV